MTRSDDPEPSFRDGRLRLCQLTCKLFWGPLDFRLKPKEYQFLLLLTSRPGNLFTHSQIACKLYHSEVTGTIIAIIVERLCRRFAAFAGVPLPIIRCNDGFYYERLERIEEEINEP